MTDHEISRMKDEGAPPPDRPRPRIGIAPPRTESHEPSRIVRIGGGGGPVVPRGNDLVTPVGCTESGAPVNLIITGIPSAPVELILPPSAEPAPVVTWPAYAEWRKSKCPNSDTLAQATLEFVGEVGELAELLLDKGPAAFYGDDRLKLIDECGDVFFCGSWALDAWGENPLTAETDEVELMRVDDDFPLLAYTKALASHPLEEIQTNAMFLKMLKGVIYQLIIEMNLHASLTCNAAKKRIYQQREQDVAKEVGRIVQVLLIVNHILIVANSSVEEALVSNRTKLDARYPAGFVTGGGNRKGAGA